jgi:hypothetical protein
MGQWLAQQKAIPIKKHGRKANSIFRVGCDYIRDAVLNIAQATQQLSHLFFVLYLALFQANPKLFNKMENSWGFKPIRLYSILGFPSRLP